MPEFPKSPNHVVDPRWNSYLRPRTSTRPERAMPVDELDQLLRVIVGRWQSGDLGAYETLEVLRDLAERAL